MRPIFCVSQHFHTPLRYSLFFHHIKAIAHIERALPVAPSRYILCLIESMRSPWIDGNEPWSIVSIR
ncbi:hypothetical protein MTBUT4_880006 [Magnetospirillum sp. UT-4]|nr:hypothetical protein MTBUT4_880006 [Magnetospirillum sp. UT-4]